MGRWSSQRRTGDQKWSTSVVVNGFWAVSLLRQAAVAQRVNRLHSIRLSLVAEAESRELCDRDGWSVANTWSTSNPKPSGPRRPRCCWPDSLAQRRADALVHHMVPPVVGRLDQPDQRRTPVPPPPPHRRTRPTRPGRRPMADSPRSPPPEPVPPIRFDPARRAPQHQRLAERCIVGDD